LVFLFLSPLCAQSGPYMVTPETATILVGDSQRFRMVDMQGRMQQNVSWAASSSALTGSVEGNELVVTGKQPGDFQIRARIAGGEARASVKVIQGASLPPNSTKWSAPAPAGCKTDKVVAAPPNDKGVDIFQTSTCPDGNYVQAYTSNGILLWRKKTSNAPGTTSVPERLDPDATSICDRLSMGASQQEVRQLLKLRGLSFTVNPSQEGVWLVEEPGAQCELLFDGKSALVRKRKILVTE
jgi:hypothetical protein